VVGDGGGRTAQGHELASEGGCARIFCLAALGEEGGLHGGQGGGGGGGMASGTSGMSGASEGETEAGREDRIPLFLRASE